MPTDAEITFADHAGRLYARRYGMAPVVGRLLGYLAICDPREQSIAELAEALLASRSAIAGAVKSLEQLGLVRRSRAAGERMDRVGIDLTSRRALGFDPTEYQERRPGDPGRRPARAAGRAAGVDRDGRVAGGTAARVGEGLAGPPRGAARGG
jgi:biotin operon repressor